MHDLVSGSQSSSPVKEEAMRHLMLFAILPLSFLAVTAKGDIHVVSPGTLGGIQGAINEAQAGDVIELTDGVFSGSGNRDIDFMGKAITVRSQSGNAETCTIDCESAGRGFYFHTGEGFTSMLEGVTILHGYHVQYGGGLYSNGASPIVRNCVFRENRCEYGGGGVCLHEQSSARIEDCLFAENLCSNRAEGYGGGIAITIGCHPQMVRCTFWRNEAASQGGGFSCHFESSCVLEDCTFFGNTAPQGSGIRLRYDATVAVFNTIVSGGEQGEAVFCELSSQVNMSCCDVYGNAGGDWVGGIEGQLGGTNICADPLFCDPESGDLTLDGASPCAPGNNPDCGLIGAWPVGCGGSTPVMVATWGALKAAFRK
jgi:hypothetical protein